MLTKEMIEYLESEQEKKYTFENTDKLELLETLLHNIGTPNPHERDDLVYPALAHLLHDKHLDEETLENTFKRFVSKEFLFFDMTNESETSVLKRSFTSLQLVILVFVHKRDNVISKDVILDGYKKFLEYYRKETVLDGYSEKYGWKHSVAHAADAFGQFVTIEYFDKEILEELFTVSLAKLKQDHYTYIHNEDERLVTALIPGIKRNILSIEFLKSWIDKFATYEKTGEYPLMIYRVKNVKSFLRSLYFALSKEEGYDELTEYIHKTLNEKVTMR